MRSLVRGRDFQSSLNSGSRKKFVDVFVTASDAMDFVVVVVVFWFTDCVVFLR